MAVTGQAASLELADEPQGVFGALADDHDGYVGPGRHGHRGNAGQLGRGHHLLDRRGPKASRWFLTLPVTPGDPDHAAIRVSRYLEDVEVESEGQSVRIPAGHVRFSVWVDDHAVSAVSLPEDEARALAEFLLSAVGALVPADIAEEADTAERAG
jgi:hypothetical protein